MTKLAKNATVADILGLPKVPKARPLKSLGATVDRYHEFRQKRLAVKKYMEEWEAEEKALYNHILDNIPKGDGGAVGKEYKAIRTDRLTFSIEDPDAFYEFVKKEDAFDMLPRSINGRSVAERLEDPKFTKKYKNGVPGLKDYKVFSLSVTKVK